MQEIGKNLQEQLQHAQEQVTLCSQTQICAPRFYTLALEYSKFMLAVPSSLCQVMVLLILKKPHFLSSSFCSLCMLCAMFGLGQSFHCPVQSSHPSFAQVIPGLCESSPMHYQCCACVCSIF